ncbi:glycoprotein IX (platelet) [Nematolebias whitei]|uniref:glycoprotein IX (platelet) n=1 Tax=Nematolebias whitei TaxID=451745 RepID=UPI00189C0497|nr:glycoprotein IX (platelet) [Nematolebias whitei]
MLPSGLTLALLLLTSSSAHRTVKSCIFSRIKPAGLHVNCSSSNLMELPDLPSESTELHVQNNRLTSVPPGCFDKLLSLNKVVLSPNPFHCDCSIQYLRSWLLKNRAVVSEEPLCSTPASLAQKAISELPDDSFSFCSFPRAHLIIASSCAHVVYNTTAGVMLLCLVLLLLWSLHLARKSSITVCLDERHSGFEANSLRFLKPKHRRRLHTGLSEATEDSDPQSWSEDLERPLIDMDLLPQVLDVLHKKHNIKIKAS